MIDEKQAAVARATESGMPDGWREVRFDEIAQLVNDRVDNPAEAGVERYVGLEHLDPESLKIRRWGAPTDVEAQKLRFQPGDIIFGKRRAYQRKVAVADFEGICSAHAMVLRAREENVVKEFLPFFMQSDTFFDRALSISVGSLSPTINWKTLADQKFALPPKDEQRRITDILRAADEVVEKDVESQEALTQLQTVQTEHFLSTGMLGWHSRYVKTPIGSLPEPWQYLNGNDLFSEKPRNGLSPEANAEGAGYPTLSIGAIRDGQVVTEGNIKYAVIGQDEAEKFRLQKGDVLIVRGNGNRNLVGRCGVVDEVPTGCFYPDLLIRIKFDETKLRSRFACLQWNSSTAHRRLLARAKSTNGIWKINGQDLRQHILAVPPIDEQDAFLRTVEPYAKLTKQMQGKVNASRTLKQRLVNSLISFN